MLSLKGFHIVFIVASIMLCLGFGVWAIRSDRLGLGIGSLAVAGALIVYLFKVVSKLSGGADGKDERKR